MHCLLQKSALIYLPLSLCSVSIYLCFLYPSFKPSAKPESCTPADRRKALYQKFYRQVQEERKPADCVVLSLDVKS
uniref:Uncharacterized protein n=1 Tax=Monopterus albus TaxID=43700 RepID=A0A3Q3J5V8_MONAL